MEQPETGVGSSESKDNVSIVGHGDGILGWRQVTLFKVALKQTSSVEIESVLQVDFLDVLVGRPTDTNHVERVSVQVERMGQVRDLN